MTQIPVLLLTGYLGSGKTTLLNRILSNEKGIKFAVIVNDIGEVNIDADHLEGYVRKAEDETEASVDSDRAIELTVRVVMFAYVRGLRQTGESARSDRSVHLGQVHPLRGATLFRLMLDAMNILLLDEAVDFADAEAADLASLFLKVCQTQHNFTVMTDEMDRTYSELMKE